MKVILTETQVKQLVQIQLAENYLCEMLNEGMSFKQLRKEIIRGIRNGIALGAVILFLNKVKMDDAERNALIDQAKQEYASIKDTKNNTDNESNYIDIDNKFHNYGFKSYQDPVFAQKVQAVKKYMEYALNNQGYTLESTKLDPEALVKASYEENFDLPLLMAAAHLESCFGATSRAQRTNSVFSVGSYDNGKNVVTYSHPNESVKGYIKLLKNDYLINGKTINDLLRPGGFVNKNGDRYASKKNYEKILKGIRNKIKTQYPQLV